MAGRVRSFSEVETETLRALARKLKEERDWNGTQLGDAMGIKQQNASRFVAPRSATGIDRGTANKLALACGFRDVEHALLDAGVMAEMTALATGNAWARRDQAQRLARMVPYPETVILAVMHRYAHREFQGKEVRWWMDRIVAESMAHVEESLPIEAKASGTGTEGR